VIFGAGALDGYAAGLPWTGGLLFLLAYSVGAVALTPLAMGAACRSALD
jgi:heme exporter protein B